MKTTHKSPRALTYKKAMSMARRCIRTLRRTPPEAPVWVEIRNMAMHYKGLAMSLSRSDNELSEASNL